MNERFTIDGSDALETHLFDVCSAVRKNIRDRIPSGKLESIFLGGGYGRGEGGVFTTAEGDRPYNDLEFYVCLQGNPRLNERTFGHALHELEENLSTYAGVEVEFKIASLKKIKNSAPSMFLYDLAMGHRTVFGSNEVLKQPKFQDSTQIPFHEATRLLMNRCSGLLFSDEKLQHTSFTAEDADFVGRNQAKAQLAFGDIVLTMLGQYHWSCRERSRRLQALAEENSVSGFPISLAKLVCHHTLGVEFKLHPQKMNDRVEEFLSLQTELRELGRNLWLWLESRRLGKRFASIQDYVFDNANKCPETNSIKNRLINLKHFGLPGLLGVKGSRYPRERLLKALPLLLWCPSVREKECELGKVQEELNTISTDFAELIQAYVALWRKYN